MQSFWLKMLICYSFLLVSIFLLINYLFFLRRGISKSSIDGLQPLPERPEEQVPLSYYGKLPATKRDSFDDSIFNGTRIASPCPLDTDRDHSRESLDSSRDQSELSDSNSWSVCTGNLTGRSSVYSWGNDDVSKLHFLTIVDTILCFIQGMTTIVRPKITARSNF